MHGSRALPLAISLVLLGSQHGLLADTFFLKSGGRIEGELLNPAEKPRQHFVVLTPGAKVTLAANQVERVTQKSVQRQHYEQLVAKMSDSADNHWKLSQWCLEKKMNTERQVHLQRVVELEPDHELARRALGFQQRDGRWLKPRDLMHERGFIHHQGAWRTAEDVELLKEKRRIELAEKEYRREIKTWSRWLHGRRRQQAVEKFRGITDPLAAPGVTSMLQRAADPATKELAIEVLGRLGGDAALAALIQCTLEDPSEAIRDRCLLQLQRGGRHAASAVFIKTLQHKSNVAVNRAAAGLQQLHNESSVLPLIKALRTEHKFVVQQPGGGINPAFGRGGNGGLSVGGGGPKIFKKKYENERVLAALVSITGENYRFNVERWIDWYQRKETPEELTLRRDP